MSQLRVLVVSSKYPPEYAGSGLRAHRTYGRLRQKFDVACDVLCGSIEENTSLEYVHEGVHVRRVAGKAFPQPSRQIWDRESLKSKIALRVNYWAEAVPVWLFMWRNHARYDVVHIFGNVAVTSAVISFCNALHKPLIVEMTYDASPRQYKPFFINWLDRSPSGFHREAKIVCISRRLQDRCREEGVVQDIWLRPNPVDESAFFPDPEHRLEYRQRLTRFSGQDIVLLNVAKFMPLKNQIFLLDVLALLPEEFKLVLSGPLVANGPNASRDAEYFKQVKQKVVRLALQNRVELREGIVDDVAALMKAADVYLLPSRKEALGTPVVESLCCAVPVVAARIIGVTDQWVRDGENGFLSSLNPKEFSEKIEQAVMIPKDTLTRNAQDVRDIASTEVIDRKYYQLLRELKGTDNV